MTDRRRFQHYPGGVMCIGCEKTVLQYAWTVPNGPLCAKCRFGDPDMPDDELVKLAQDITVERFRR